MDIIALIGSSNVGKTLTLNILYSLLIADGYVQVFGHFADHANNDFMDILEKNGLLIGIATQGDYSRELPKYLTYLNTNGCVKTICACTNSKVGTLNAINVYSNTKVNKTIDTIYRTQRITNTIDAVNLKTLI